MGICAFKKRAAEMTTEVAVVMSRRLGRTLEGEGVTVMYPGNGQEPQEQPSVIWMPGLQAWANSLPWPIDAGVGFLVACVGFIAGLRFGGENVQWAGAFIGFVSGCLFIRLLVLLIRVTTQLVFIAGLILALYFIAVRIANSSKDHERPPAAVSAPSATANPEIK
jgi:uncharacterized membrane protein